MDGWTLSYIVLWIIVLAEGAVLVVLLRTFGSFYLNTRSGMSRDGLAIGTRAPRFNAETIRGDTINVPGTEGRWLALFSVTATCEECYAAMPALAELQGELGGLLRVVMLLPVDSAEMPDMPALRDTPLDVAVVGHQGLRREYRIRVLPFVHVLDPDGIVRAKGLMHNRDGLEHLLAEAGLDHPLTSRHQDEHHGEEAHAHG